MQAEQASTAEGAGADRAGEQSVVAAVVQTVKSQFASHNLFIGLDRDGTIVPYADRPEDARVDPELSELLDCLSKKKGIKVGIISARSIAQLRGDFDAKKLFLAGNYGMEISSPQGDVFIQPFALDAVPALKEVRDQLAAHIKPETGAILEDHGYSLCLHWHLVPPDRLPRIEETVATLKKAFPGLMFSTLPTSYEVKPLTTWNKGEALNQIFKTYHQMLNDSFALYAGDSSADEPAFAWANARGGISLKVGNGKFDTCSSFQIVDLKMVRMLLGEISRLERN